MKRSIVGAVASGCLAFSLVAGVGSATADAAGRAKQTPHLATASGPQLTVTPSQNLVAGETVTLVGSGFPKDALLNYTECNGDGAGPGPLGGSCDLATLDSVTASSTGTFKATYKIVTGAMSTKPDTSCSMNIDQAQHGVQCAIGVADLHTSPYIFAEGNIWFAPPALSFTYTKAGMVGGRQTYKVVISDKGDYAVGKGGLNAGGFTITSEYVSSSGAVSPSCQGSTNGMVWSLYAGEHACNKFFGEFAEISWDGTKIAAIRVGVKNPGSFNYVIAHARSGAKETIAVVGASSGTKLSASITVP